jgi:hypothetical protein
VQPQANGAAGDAQHFDLAAVGAQEWTDIIERLPHAGFHVQGMKSIEQEHVAHQVVARQGVDHGRAEFSLISDGVEDFLKGDGVQVQQPLNNLLDLHPCLWIGKALRLGEKRFDPLHALLEFPIFGDDSHFTYSIAAACGFATER